MASTSPKAEDTYPDPFKDAPEQGGIVDESPLFKAWGCRDFTIKTLPPVHSDEVFELDYVTDCEVMGLATSPVKTYGSFGGSKGKNYSYAENDFFYLQDGIHSLTQTTLDHSALVVEFRPELKQRFLSEIAMTTKMDEPILARSSLVNAQCHAMMIQDFLRSDGFGGRLRAESIMALMLGDICRTLTNSPCAETNQSGLSDVVLNRVTEFIDAHIDTQISLERLAETANISQFHFARLFKEATGLPPHRFVIEHRVTKAIQLLEKRKMSLAEIAYSVGFSSQAHFSTAFRKSVGMTPGQFRRSL